MATFRAQVVFPYFTNLPKDVWTNTLHFTEVVPIGLEAAADLITPRLQTFYDAIYDGMGGMANYCTSIGQHVNWYDLSTPPPRVPYSLPITVSIAGSTTIVPPETSIVLSFQGLRVAGEAQARRRGRAYLGGLPTGAISPSAAGSAFPNIAAVLRELIGDQAEILKAGGITDGVRWSVFSPTTGLSHFVEDGWVDNAPDTQRRRGQDASGRSLWGP